MSVRKWTPKMDALLAQADDEAAEMLAKILGVSVNAAAERRRRVKVALRALDDPETVARIRELWGTRSQHAIGRELGLREGAVAIVGDHLGLPRGKRKIPRVVKPAPPTPPKRNKAKVSYPRATLAWAAANLSDPEAQMIARMVARGDAVVSA